MSLKPFAIAIALLALGGALWLLIVAVRRRHWSSLFQVVPALCLLSLVAVLVSYIFGLNAPHSYFNAPAPVPDTASVYSLVGTGLDAYGPRLVAVNARTGQQRWQDAAVALGASFAQDGDMLYVVSYHAGGTSLSALNGATGASVWRQDVPNMLAQSPSVIVDGALILAVRDVSSGHVGPQQLYAFRLSDGRQLWRALVGKPDSGSIQLYGGSGVVITHIFDDVMQVWRVSDGQLLWHTPRFDGQIMVGANSVFELTRDGDVIDMSAQTGTVVWRSSVPGDLHTGVIAQNGVYVTAQRDDTNASGLLVHPIHVYAFDLASGHHLWSIATKSLNGGAIVASANGVYVDVAEGIYALRPSDGRLLWRSNMGSWALLAGLSPFVGQVLYVSRIEAVPTQQLLLQQGQTYLYALNQNTGSPYWKMPIGPLVTTHSIFVF